MTEAPASLTEKQTELMTVISTALKVREAGNEKFKNGDLSGALRDYHTVLLSLRGLEAALSIHFEKRYRPIASKRPSKPWRSSNFANRNRFIDKDTIEVKEQEQEEQEEEHPQQKVEKAGLGQIFRAQEILERLQIKLGPEAGIARTLAQEEYDQRQRDKAEEERSRRASDEETTEPNSSNPSTTSTLTRDQAVSTSAPEQTSFPTSAAPTSTSTPSCSSSTSNEQRTESVPARANEGGRATSTGDIDL
ncbi:hypothetical protein JCM5350_001931 [Sporobolomyces pararoseus]